MVFFSCVWLLGHTPSPAPTLPAGVSLGLLQGLGGGSEGDALEDVNRVAKEAQLLVDAP